MIQYELYEVMVVTFDEIIQFLKNPWVIVLIIFLVSTVFIVVMIRVIRKKNIRKRVNQCEITYNDCISVPISFKLNKANKIAKVNPNQDNEIQNIKNDYHDLEKRHKEIALLLEDVDDALSFGKLGLAARCADDLEILMEDTEILTKTLDTRLDKVLEEEISQREEITSLKDKFRTLKSRLVNNGGLYGNSYDLLEEQSKSIESKFSMFEEWMFASDYEKAKAISLEIAQELEDIDTKLDKVPKLYEVAKGTIPELLDSISSDYQEARNHNVYLGHMDVPKSIIFVTDKVKESLKKISQLDLEEASSSLTASKEALEAMIEAIDKEVSAHFEMRDKMNSSFKILDEYIVDVKKLIEKAPKVEARLGYEGFAEDLDNFRQKAIELDEKRNRIEARFAQNDTPASKQVLVMNGLIQSLDEITEPFYELNEKIIQANADEVRAQEQLRKLYLIINDVEVRIKKRSLPTISDKYIHDLERSRTYVYQINTLLEEDILDVTTLNGTVAEAIDYIYQLHNNVNNLVGVVDMCENSILYANKYRAYVPSIDSELTKAELAFNNGEYTQSLTMIINAIEKFRPNASYERIIKENARSAR